MGMSDAETNSAELREWVRERNVASERQRRGVDFVSRQLNRSSFSGSSSVQTDSPCGLR